MNFTELDERVPAAIRLTGAQLDAALRLAKTGFFDPPALPGLQAFRDAESAFYDLTHRVQRKVWERRRQGDEALNLYLGRKEVKVIRDYAVATGYRDATPHDPNRRAELLGIGVFAVDAESHLAVSATPEE